MIGRPPLLLRWLYRRIEGSAVWRARWFWVASLLRQPPFLATQQREGDAA